MHARAVLRVKALKYDALSRVHRDRARGLPCLYCWLPMSAPTWDHVVPLSKGGPNTRGNLVVVCRYCNADKGDLSLFEYEGFLKATNHEQGRRVALFSRWVIEDWPESDRAEFERIVAHAWADAMRARVDTSATSIDVRNFLSRTLRSNLERRRAAQ